MSDKLQFRSTVKAVDKARGIVTALVSVFGNLDSDRDVVLHGAFDATIAKWKAKMVGSPPQYLPVVYGHQDVPGAILGKVLDMRVTGEGLEVDEQYFLGKPEAAGVFAAIVEGVLPGSSFTYDIIRAKSNEHGGLNLAEMALLEVGPTLYPSNTSTRVLAAKGDAAKAAEEQEELEDKVAEPEAKAGREFSTKNVASLMQMHDAVHEMLGMAGHDQASGSGGKAQEPEGGATEGKTEEPLAKVEDHPYTAENRRRFEDERVTADG